MYPGKNLKAQSLKICHKREYILLFLESREEDYPLNIANCIEAASDYAFIISNHIFEYLESLYKLGFVERRWETELEQLERKHKNQGGSRKRRYWRITQTGRAALRERRRFKASLADNSEAFTK